jgi:transposase
MKARVKIREIIKGLDRKGVSERIKKNELTPEDQRILLIFVRIIPALLETLRKKQRQMGGLLTLLLGKKSESSRDILKQIEKEKSSQKESQNKAQDETQAGDMQDEPCQSEPGNVIPLNPLQKPKRNYKKNRKNGRSGTKDYPNADIEILKHEILKPGDSCPKCGMGSLYLLKSFGKFIQFIGSPLLRAKIYLQQKLRCSACRAIFQAKLPVGVASSRATPSASAIIALIKYGAGFPFYRMSTVQKYLKIPISPSGIWMMLEPLIPVALKIFQEMRRQAAQGEVFHNDDTVNKILDLIKTFKTPVKRRKKQRKKIFTSGILSKVGAVQIVLFFTGHKNAGENLEDLLAERDKELGIPIQMADASTMNKPGSQKTQEGGCLTHYRRGFVKSYRGAKQGATYVIERLQEVYRTENEAKQKGLNAEERLKLHQEKSEPIMEELKKWMDDQIDGKKVEENSALGDAIGYGRRHWTKLTLFLRVAGAPLANDELEQKFKMVKQHGKNSLFYKTPWGALVGDLFMSTIHTCVLAKENPFDYLVAIQEYRDFVLKNPDDWMPWNYPKALAAARRTQSAA